MKQYKQYSASPLAERLHAMHRHATFLKQRFPAGFVESHGSSILPLDHAV